MEGAQCTSLESIDVRWSLTLTVEDWSRLSNFQHLRSLTVRSLCAGNPSMSDLSHALSTLMHCRSLRALTLHQVQLRTEHAALLARIPSLERFEGSWLHIESLAPLSAAPALTLLDLDRCFGFHGEDINVRELIPFLPLLRTLTIEDYYRSYVCAEAAAPFHAALQQRLPSLTELNSNMRNWDDIDFEFAMRRRFGCTHFVSFSWQAQAATGPVFEFHDASISIHISIFSNNRTAVDLSK